MPSESKQARETQKEYYRNAVQSRRNLLVEKGVDKDRISKDPHLKHLQAQLRRTVKRISALEALEKKKDDMALRKQQKLEAKKAIPEATSAASPEEGKKKQKKEQKKEKKKEE